MIKLLVHKTLMTGGLNHWMLCGCKCVSSNYNDKPAELYEVSKFRLWLLTIFEFFCGWHKQYLSVNECWIFVKNESK